MARPRSAAKPKAAAKAPAEPKVETENVTVEAEVQASSDAPVNDDGFEVARMDDPGVTVTHEMPANADKTSNPIPNDAEINQAPVRSGRPDLPIAQVLGSGAGAHEVIRDEHLGTDGRWYADPNDAAEQRGELVPEPVIVEGDGSKASK